jgi:hypothetical protein
MPTSLRFLIVPTFLAAACAQTPSLPANKPGVVITWFGPGALQFPGKPWTLQSVHLYDKGQRPVVMFSNETTKVDASLIVFENLSGQPTGEGCRGDVIDPLVKGNAKTLSGRADSQFKAADGKSYPVTSYALAMTPKVKQENVFIFAGDEKTCVEEHVSLVGGTPDDPGVLAALAEFHPMLGYSPQFIDYLHLATLLFHDSPGLAAPYYKEALDRADQLPWRRVVTDQLVMSLGMSGDLKDSRAVAEMAISKDPDYPLNYYNLACADAEEGNATQARVHLDQAFARKANVIPGEHLPDPSKDDSILKLKKNKEFWTFVQTLQ